MAVYTLAEQARREQNPIRAGVMNVYAEASDIFKFLPIQSIGGNSYTYNTRTALPSVAFRGINESFVPSRGVINPQTEFLRIAGGEIDLDTYLADTQADRSVGDLMASEVSAQGTAMAKFLTRAFFKGNATTDPRQFDGLQRRLVGSQLIAAGSTSGGDVLTRDKLDELIDAVVGGPSGKVLFMSRWMRRAVNKLVRASGEAFEAITDSFGAQRYAYASVPIVEIEEDHADAEILGFSEACPGGGSSVGSSIYCVRFGADQYVSALQNSKGMIVSNLGLLQSEPKYRTRVQWYITLAVFHGRSAARLWGIKQTMPS